MFSMLCDTAVSSKIVTIFYFINIFSKELLLLDQWILKCNSCYVSKTFNIEKQYV